MVYERNRKVYGLLLLLQYKTNKRWRCSFWVDRGSIAHHRDYLRLLSIREKEKIGIIEKIT